MCCFWKPESTEAAARVGRIRCDLQGGFARGKLILERGIAVPKARRRFIPVSRKLNFPIPCASGASGAAPGQQEALTASPPQRRAEAKAAPAGSMGKADKSRRGRRWVPSDPRRCRGSRHRSGITGKGQPPPALRPAPGMGSTEWGWDGRGGRGAPWSLGKKPGRREQP